MRFIFNKYFLISINLVLFGLITAAAQVPAWDSGTPSLRPEVRSVGLTVNLDQVATVYYVMYRTSVNDPGAGALTAAQIKANTGPASGRVANGSFAFGDGSYCRNSGFPTCLSAASLADSRVYSVDPSPLAGTGTYRVYMVAENGSGFSTVWDGTVTSYTLTSRCQAVGQPLGGSTGPTKGILFTPPANNCSPAQYFVDITYIGVDYSPTAPVEAIVNFGEAGITGTAYTLPLQNSALGTPEMNKAFRRYYLSIPWTYDYLLGHNPGSNAPGSGCTFHIDINLGACTGVNTEIDLDATVWDKPNTARGRQDIEPNGMNNDDAGANDEEFEICEGSRGLISLTDNSVFNCTTVEDARAPLPNSPNREARWVQFVYGAAGTTVTTSGAANDQVTIGGVNFTAAQLPIYGPVVYIPASVAANPFTAALPVQMPINSTTGQVLVVKMRSWNTCLPYDSDVSDVNGLNPSGGTYDLDSVINTGNNDKWISQAGAVGTWPGNASTFPFANTTPMTLSKQIIVMDAPAPPTFSPDPYVVCEELTSGNYNITFGNVTGTNPVVRAYSDAALTSLQKTDNTAAYTYNPATEGGVAFDENNPGTYTRYATVTADAGNSQTCTSLPVTIPIVIEEKVIPGVIAHPGPLTICTGDDPAAFTSTTAASGGRDGTPTYQWQSAFVVGGPYTDIAGATSVTYNPPAISSGDRTFFRRAAISDNGGVATNVCATAFSNVIQFTVNTPVIAGAINGAETLCLTGDPAVMGNQTTPTGGNGTYTNYQWEESTTSNLGPFNTIVGATSSTYDPGIAGVLTQTTHYRRRITSGVCSADADANGIADNVAYTTAITKTVNQLVVPGSIDNAQVLCAGDDPAALTSTAPASGGDGVTYTYQWQRSTTSAVAGFANIVGETALTFDPGALTVTTWYKRIASSGLCTAAESNVIEITVNALPAVVLSGGGSACGGNNAADVVFTFSGTGPFDLVYAIDGVNQPVQNNVTSPFAISAPPDGVYTVVSVTDSNSPNCAITAPHVNITGSASVSTIATLPPTIQTFTVSAAVCDDGGTTDPPDATLNLSPDLPETYNITYRIRRISTNTLSGLFTLNNVVANASGEITISPTYANLGGAADVQGYRIELASIINVSTLCSGSPGNSDILIINPRPTAPVSGGNEVVCSDAIGAADVGVTDPDGGGPITIDWYAAATGGAVLSSGTGVATFNPDVANEPAAGTEVSYFAESRNGTTGCISTTRTEVKLRSDAVPTAPAITPVANTCSDVSVLTGNAETNGGKGTWTVGGAIYYETFSTDDNGLGISGPGIHATSFAHPSGNWTVTTPANNTLTANTEFIRVNGNTMYAQDVNTAEVVWLSRVVDISTSGNVSISAQATEIGTQAGTDYVRLYYKINGGAETLLGDITDDLAVDGQFQTFNSPSIAGNTLQIVARMRNNGAGEGHKIDNIFIKSFGTSLPIIADVNSPTSAVTQLQDGVNTFTWSIQSAFGACTLTPAVLTITKNPQPVTADINFDLCETIAGSLQRDSYNLTVHDAAVAGGIVADRTVAWFTDAALSLAVPDATNVDVIDNEVYYARVTVVSTGCTNITPVLNPGSVTFNVNPLPAVATPTLASRSFCEDVLGTSSHAGVNLSTSYNTQINATATITWFPTLADAQAITNQIAAGVGVGQVGNFTVSDGLSLFARVVDGNSCVNFQEVEFTVHSLPDPNNIIGPSGSFSATVTVCKSNTIILFQLDPDLNDRGGFNPTYDWVIPTGVGEFELFGGGGTGDFFVLLKFPNAVPGPGLALQVRERTSATSTPPGCWGAYNTINIIVEDSPAPPVIVGLEDVCADQQSVSYTLQSITGTSTYTWTIPSVAPLLGSIVSGQGTGTITMNIGPDVDGTTTFFTPHQISVSEQSASGCNSVTPDTHDVRVHDKPTFTVTNNPICSGSVPDLTFTPTVPGTTFTWEVLSPIVGSVSGANVGNTGTGVPNQTLTNTSGSPAAVTYRVTAFGPDISALAGNQLCQGEQKDITVIVNPEPIVTAVSNVVVCSGDPIALITFAANTAGGETFNWTNDNIAIGQALTGTGNLAAYTAPVNITGVDIVGTINVTATKSSCTSTPANSKSFTITIKPQPVVTALADITQCPETMVNVPSFVANTGGGETFTWTNSNPAIGLAAAGTGDIATFALATNLTGANVTATITVTATKNGCTSAGANAKSFVITILPAPVVDPIANSTVCPGELINAIAFTSNTGGGETYDWTNDNTAVGLAASGNGNIGSFVAPANTTGTDVVATVTVNGTATNTCVGPDRTFTITLKPQPVVANVTDISVCSGETISAINFSANTGGGEVFDWTNTNTSIGLLASGTGSIASYTAPTNFTGVDMVATITVTATKNACVSAGANRETFTITIKPQPVVNAITNVSVCSGEAIAPINFAANSGGGETFNWTNTNTALGLAASGTGSIAGYTAPDNFTGIDITGTITVTATKNGCISAGANSKTFTITIKPQPVVGAVANISVCSGDAISAINFVANTGGGETFDWTNTNVSIGLGLSGSGNIASYTAPSNVTGVDIVGTITVTATKNACISAGANTKTFTITIKPQPVVSNVTNIIVCSGEAVPGVVFAANTGGGETFAWSNSNPSIGLAANGTGDIITYTAPSNFTGVDIVGTITVNATKNGCTSTGANTEVFTITIRPQPVVTAISNITVCSGDLIPAIVFAANTAGGETFDWSNNNLAIGLGATGTGNIASYTAPDNFTGSDVVATLNVIATKNGCISAGANTKTFTITIKPQPVVVAVGDITVCSGDAIPAVAFSANTGGSEVFSWSNTNTSIGLGATGTGNISSYTAPNNFTGSDIVGTIVVTATKNGCTSVGVNTKTFTITIRPQPVVTAVANVSVCSGATINVGSFTANTGGGEVFTWTNTNTSIGLAANGVGDIASYAAPLNTTGVDITGTLVVTASKNGCTSSGSNSKTFTITIKPEPVVSNVTNVEVCSGASISGINFSANTGGGETFTWTNTNTGVGLALSGSGNISSYTAPINISGVDIVGTLVVSASKNGCTSTGANQETFTITIKPEPVVAAVGNVIECSGATVGAISFSANTAGGETFTWTNSNPAIGLGVSGTGNIASYTAPINLTGSSLVGTIVVTAAKNGCTSSGSNSKSFTITIKPEPVVSSITNVEVCSGASIAAINFSANTAGGETFDWTNSNPLIGLAASGTGNIATYTAPDNFTGVDMVASISVTATKNGCISTGANAKTFTIIIKPQPVVAAVANVSECSGDLIAAIPFTANTAGGETFTWTNSNALIGLSTSGSGSIGAYTAPNNFTGSDIVGTIVVTATKNGCTSVGVNTKTFTITIRPQPVVTAVANISVCSGATINVGNFAANTLGGEVFSWTNSNASIGLAASGTGDITPFLATDNFSGSDNVAIITIIATKNGCTSTGSNAKTFTITIRPEPVVNAISNVDVCSGATVSAISFGANTSGGESYTWTNTNTGVGIAAAGSGTIASYTAPVNITASDIVATVTVSATRSTCTSSPANRKSFTITIKPQPHANATTVAEICSDDTFSIDLQDIINAAPNGNSVDSKYSFSVITTSTNSPAVAPGPFRSTPSAAMINHIYENKSNTDAIIEYEVTPLRDDAFACEGAPFVVALTVHAEPVGIGYSESICSDDAINNIFANHIDVIGGNSLTSVYEYSITQFPVVPALTLPVDRTVKSGAGIADTYTNNTGTDIEVTYLITPYNSLHPTCDGTPFTYKVVISTAPTASSAAVSEVCSDSPYSINPQNNVTNGVTISAYDWTANYNGLTVNGSAPGSGATNFSGLLAGALTNKTVGQVVVTFTVTPYSPSNCPGNDFEIYLPVDPEPVIDPSVTPRTICSDVATNIVLGPLAGTTASLDYNISLISQDTPDLIGTPTTGNNLPANALEFDQFNNKIRTSGLFVRYSVTPNAPVTAAGTCQGDALIVQVEVLPEPVMNPALSNQAVCSDVETGIVLESDGVSVLATGFYLNSVELLGTDIGGTQTVGNVSSIGNVTAGVLRQGKNFIQDDVFRTKVADGNAANRTIAYRVTPASAPNTALPSGPAVGCLGDEFVINVEIKPEPVLQATINPAPVCSDDEIDVTLDSGPTSVTIDLFRVAGVTWDPLMIKGPSNVNVGDTLVGSPNLIEDFYTNTTSLIRTATYTVVPITEYAADNLFCEGDPDGTIVIDISPAPAVADALDNVVCSDTDAEIIIRDVESVNSVGFGAQSFVITRGSTAGLTPVTEADLSSPFNGTDNISAIENDRYINPTSDTIQVLYRVQAWTGAGASLCASPLKDIYLTVEPSIVAVPVNTNAEICSGEDTEIELTSPTNPSAGDITFTITVPAAPAGITGFATASNLSETFVVGQTLTNNNNTPTTLQYRVTPKAASAAGGTPGCTGAAVFVDVLVQPRPRLIADANETICEDDALAIAFSTTTTPSIGVGYGGVEYEVLLPVTNPTGTISGNSITGDVFATSSTLADVLTTTSLNQEVITYTLRPRFEVPGTVESSAALAGYCVGAEKEITVTVSPRAQLAAPANVEVCSGEEFTQTLVVTDADPSATLITWTRVQNPATGITGSSNGAGDNITQVLFNSTNDVGSVTYTFTPKSFNCVGPTAALVATVLPTPKLEGLPSSVEICNNADFELDLDFQSPTINATFEWSVDNSDILVSGSTGGNGTAIDDTWNNSTEALATVTYTILPMVLKSDLSTECTGPEKIVSLNIAPPISAKLTSSTGDEDAFLCEGGRDFIFFENTGLPSFEMTYRIAGATTTDVTLTKQGSIKLLEVSPTVTTTYTILSVKDAFDCAFTPTSDHVVTVNVGNTNAAFDIVGDAIACSPFPAAFAYNQQSGVNYNWKWFNGDPDSTYIASANVASQTVKHIFENPAPTATVKFKVFLETSFPDAADPDDNYPGACFKTTFKEVQVYPTVAPAVFADKTEICSGEEVRFVNTSQGVRSDKFFYRVQGSTGELEPRPGVYTPPQRPATSTVYELSNLTATNPLVLEMVYQSSNLNCPAADVVIPITVYRGVTADFTNTTPTVFIGGHSFVDVMNASNPIDANDFTYEWNFGLDATPADLNGTTPPNPIDYTTPGLKEISLLVTNILAGNNGLVCADEIRKTIDIVVPPLVANFTAIPLAACYPTDITIVENLATGDEFEWELIDEGGRTSATSNANLPVFAISNPGTYTIFLTTRNSFTGDEATESKELEVFELPTASFEVRPAVVFIPDQEITTFNFSTGANLFEWDFGDGNTSTQFEPKITYKVEGEYPITLIAGFDHGNRDVDGDGLNDGNVICYDTLSRSVQAKDGGITRIPNSFTPSPNGPNGGNAGNGSFNDVFLPITKGVEEFMMQVFDRWGNLVFESRDKNQGWDGYHRNGNLLPAGVYVYKLELRLSNGQRTTQVGDITLIR